LSFKFVICIDFSLCTFVATNKLIVIVVVVVRVRGAYANVTQTGVTAVKSSREKEKKDMQDLNERFASYIEKVRFLEAQNRRLADELEKLKAKWGKETTQIKAMYQAELDEARKCLDDSDKEKARLEIRVASLEEQLEELRQKYVVYTLDGVHFTRHFRNQSQLTLLLQARI